MSIKRFIAGACTILLMSITPGRAWADLDAPDWFDARQPSLYPSPTNKDAWTRIFRLGFAGKPGRTQGEPVPFGSISGGRRGTPYRVWNSLDSGPGSLRDALESKAALWIYVDSPLTIELSRPIEVQYGNKTLIGSKPQGDRLVTLLGYGLRVRRTYNVAISGVTVVDADGDAFEITESRVVHLHNCHALGFSDGGIDIVRGSTDVTISETAITTGIKAMLIGASPTPFVRDNGGVLGVLSDTNTRVTLWRVWFDSSTRMPLVRHAEAIEIFEATMRAMSGAPMVESSHGAHVRLVSGSVVPTHKSRIAASGDPAGRLPGFLYVGPAFDAAGHEIIAANWSEAAALPGEPFRSP